MVDDSLNDHVIIAGVQETEHHEVAVYEGLITNAEAMGAARAASARAA
jgi:ferritin-like metal-binding protein YciE